tara:strand:+ start:112 stop:405 length:294 start_codon:yes stop_codon:yes gene_type:complete
MSSDIFNDIAAGLTDAIAHAEGDDTGRRVTTVSPVDVAKLRERLGLSQNEFAEAFGVSVGTIRNWEQGRRAPRGPAKALLLVIDREPEAVLRALNAA